MLLFLLAFLILVGVGAGSYYLGMRQATPVYNAPVKQVTTAKVTVTPSPTPDPTATWQQFTNATYFYSLKYPQGLVAKETNTYYHYVDFTATGAALPKFLVSAIPDNFVAQDPAAYNYMSSDWINNINNLTVGETKTMDAAGATYTRLPDTTVDGQMATAIQVHATGSTQERVYVKDKAFIYMLATYYQTPADLSDFQLFLSAFRFTQ